MCTQLPAQIATGCGSRSILHESSTEPEEMFLARYRFQYLHEDTFLSSQVILTDYLT